MLKAHIVKGGSVAVFEWLEERQLLSLSVINPPSDVTAGMNAAPTVIDVSHMFGDVPVMFDGSTSNQLITSVARFKVLMGTTVGTIDVGLYSQQTPLTVADFLSYVLSGLYNNTFIHRSVPGFVLQGGGYTLTQTGPAHITTGAPVQNEPGISNVRGTIAMAKTADDPDSATSEWFFNLVDNNSADPNSLDNQNGGFTVFGTVLGNGMQVVDNIAALPTYNAGSPFDQLPLVNYTPNTDILSSNLVWLQSVTVLPMTPSAPKGASYLTLSVTSSNPSLVLPSFSGSSLSLKYLPNTEGTATITVKAVDPAGNALQDTFSVTVGDGQFGTVGNSKNVKLYMIDADGTAATFTLTGNGAGQVVTGPNGWDLTLTGTDARSSLAITTSKPTQSSDGQITLHNIVVGDPLNTSDHTFISSILAGTTNLSGDLTITGSVTTLTLNDIAAQHVLTIGSPATGSGMISLTFGQVTDATLTSGTPIKMLSVKQWLDTDATPDVIATPWLTTLTVKGNFQADLDLPIGNVNPNQPTLGSATITGDLTGAEWNITGSVGKITVGGAVDVWTLHSTTNTLTSVSSLKLGNVTQANVTVDGLLGTVQATQWSGGTINSYGLNSLTVSGDADFGAQLEVYAQSSQTVNTLKTVKIAGNVNGTTWDIDGKIGALTIGGNVTDWQLFSSQNSLVSLGSLTLGNVSSAWVYVAGPVGAVRAKEWRDGEIAADTISSLTTTGDAGNGLLGNWGATVTLIGPVNPAQTTLSKASIAGNITGEWDMDGKTGSITVNGTAANWTFHSTADALSSVASLKLGSVSSADLTVDGTLNTVQAKEWLAGAITATSISSLKTIGSKTPILAGDFAADVTLTGPSNPKQLTLSKASFSGQITGGAWNVTGNVGSLTANSTGSAWTPDFLGNVASLTVNTDAAGQITAGSIKTLTVKGNLQNANITLTQGVPAPGSKTKALTTMTVTGRMDHSSLWSAGNVGKVTIGAMQDSNFFAGVQGTVVAHPSFRIQFNVVADNLLPTISSLTVRGLTGQPYSFLGSNIAAWSLGAVSIKDVQMDNPPDHELFGVTANTIGSYTRLAGSIVADSWTSKSPIAWPDDSQGDYEVLKPGIAPP